MSAAIENFILDARLFLKDSYHFVQKCKGFERKGASTSL